MSDEPWWAYPDDDAWRSSDGAVTVRVTSSSVQLVGLEITTPTLAARATWDPQVEMLSMVNDVVLEKPTFAAVKQYIASAAEPRELAPTTQLVLDLVSETLSRESSTSLKVR